MGTPEEKPEDTQSKVDWQERYQNQQAALTKAQQAQKANEKENEILRGKVQVLTAADLEPLEELKLENPEAWRQKVNAMEIEKQNLLDQELHQAGVAASAQTELERRSEVLAEFNENHPDLVLTDEVIQWDVPPRFTQQLDEGKVSFEQYLKNVYEYLKAPKTAAGKQEQQTPNLNALGGGSEAQDQTPAATFDQTYEAFANM